jgi:hypothetical protein
MLDGAGTSVPRQWNLHINRSHQPIMNLSWATLSLITPAQGSVSSSHDETATDPLQYAYAIIRINPGRAPASISSQKRPGLTSIRLHLRRSRPSRGCPSRCSRLPTPLPASPGHVPLPERSAHSPPPRVPFSPDALRCPLPTSQSRPRPVRSGGGRACSTIRNPVKRWLTNHCHTPEIRPGAAPRRTRKLS